MKYNYKIVVDSCCELPEELRDDERFERVPLEIEVGDDYRILDDENFDQKDFLRRVAECPKCPKSSCPSPESYMNAYRTEAERVYVVTLTSKLSGSYNSAVLGKIYMKNSMGTKYTGSRLTFCKLRGDTDCIKAYGTGGAGAYLCGNH